MIYFVLALDGSNHIKIGTTVRLTERLKQLAVLTKTELRVLGVMNGGHAEEQALHDRFEAHWIHGEWFVSNPELTDFIAMECRPWDGRDDSPLKLSSVKLDMDVVEAARIVAAYHPYKTMSDLLSEILRPILTKMEQEAVEDRAKKPKRTKGQKP